MNRMGIIGSGPIGSAIARLAVAAGYEALLSNSRGPESLTELIDELGPLAQAGTSSEAAVFGEIPVLAVPLGAYRDLPIDALAGKTVLSTGNYYPIVTVASSSSTSSRAPRPSTSSRCFQGR